MKGFHSQQKITITPRLLGPVKSVELRDGLLIARR